MEVAVGDGRRDLPLFSFLYILHKPHAISSAGEVLMETGPLRWRIHFFFVFLSLLLAPAVARSDLPAVEAANADLDPSEVLIARTKEQPWRIAVILV